MIIDIRMEHLPNLSSTIINVSIIKRVVLFVLPRLILSLLKTLNITNIHPIAHLHLEVSCWLSALDVMCVKSSTVILGEEMRISLLDCLLRRTRWLGHKLVKVVPFLLIELPFPRSVLLCQRVNMHCLVVGFIEEVLDSWIRSILP